MYYLVFILTLIASLGFSDTKNSSSSNFTNLSDSILLSAGVANEVHLVNSSTSQPYILKIFNNKKIEELKQTELLVKDIRDAGIKVPESIIPPIQIESKVISVFSYVNGFHISESNLPEVAKLMGKLHLIPSLESPLPPLKNYNQLFKNCKNWKYSKELKKIFNSLDLSYRDFLPRGLIHGDFSYTNLLVDKENNLTLLDFDHLRNDILLTDLVRSYLFYGFNQQGKLKEDITHSFVATYNQIRPLKAAELDVFYTHMKLCLIDAALEMYDHMYVKKDLPIDRVDGNPFNACLNPDLIAREILSIKDKISISLDKEAYPIFFFGLSGVGKTTLIHLLNSSSNLFYIPKFTVTREPRKDDDPRYFEYLSVNEFLKFKDKQEFFLWMKQEETYYGYRFKNLTEPCKYALMNASAYGIDSVSCLKGVKILIEGNAEKGLKLRQNTKIEKTREKVNQIVQERFFNKDLFRNKMNLIYYNQFGDPKESSQKLKRQILENIDHSNGKILF